MRLGTLVFIGVCAWGGWHWYQTRPVAQISPGTVAAAEPDQTRTRQAEFSLHGYTIKPLAHFKVRARVLSREDYRADKEADLSPTDLALGWGRMSDSAVYGQLHISQSGRFYFWRYDNEPPIPTDEIVRSSANMHLIPANSAVRGTLAKVRPGQVVRFEGELIEATEPGGWRWRSSLTREDSGAGACEVIWVETLETE
jgi:hypothetical protein